MGSPGSPPVLQALLETFPGARFSWSRDPWLPFPWSVQAGSGPSGGMLYGEADAAEIEWARALCQLSLSHPPVPLIYPRDPQAASAERLAYAWSLNRVVQGELLDQALAQAGYDPLESQRIAKEELIARSGQLPAYIKALLLLELLYRGIPIAWQKELQAACGEDEMRAAHQLNRVCIRPGDPDRTLLQVHHLGLKISGAEEQLRSGLRLQLSDGRQVELV